LFTRTLTCLRIIRIGCTEPGYRRNNTAMNS
jgi:hypothetical protein